MKAKIIRIEQTNGGTFGVLLLNERVSCWTLELPWRNNEPRVSCIPVREYVCKRVYSPKFREVFEVRNVPDRSRILIHAGNDISEIEGCILLGRRIGINHLGNRGLLESGAALGSFMEQLENIESFDLEIRRI